MARTAVAILDRDDWEANTDILVVVDDARRRLTWVPRDLYSPRLGDRVNAAFRMGGCALLLDALADVGFRCDGAICFRRAASERVLASVDVKVPVPRPLAFWYPLAPTRPIEEGRRQIIFEPPSVRLTGERVHQWIGARKSVSGPSSDLHRLERQGTLLKVLLESGFDFRPALGDRALYRDVGGRVLAPLARVDAGWSMAVFRSVENARIDGRAVLVRSSLAVRSRRLLERGLSLILRRAPRAPRPVPGKARRGAGAIAWGAHVSPAFKARLTQMCAHLEVEPSAMMAIIAFETARSFSPAVRNPLSGATGLIQFTPATAAELGTTTDRLASLSATEQLDYVERYLTPYAGRMKTLSDAYMAVLWPDAVGAPPSQVLFADPSGPYVRNRGLDADGDGRITKAEATAPVSRRLDEGLAPGNVG